MEGWDWGRGERVVVAWVEAEVGCEYITYGLETNIKDTTYLIGLNLLFLRYSSLLQQLIPYLLLCIVYTVYSVYCV